MVNVFDFDEEQQLFLRKMFGGIAHEIRNPLQGIIAAGAALACRSESDPSAQIFLSMINHETGRISRIVDQLMQIFAPVVIEHKAVSLQTILNDAAARATSSNPDYVKCIGLKISSDLPALPSADPESLVTAFAAILENAIEANPNQNVSVTLTNSENNFTVMVKDSGEGMDEEAAKHAFEPFFSTKKRKSGLGLTVAQRIIRYHSGAIRIVRSDETGTLIQMDLPK